MHESTGWYAIHKNYNQSSGMLGMCSFCQYGTVCKRPENRVHYYTQDNTLLFRPNCWPRLVHLWLLWLLYTWCNILYITHWQTCLYCSFCCFLKITNIFCVGELFFFYPPNSLNRVRICAGTPYMYSAPRDLQKQDRVKIDR